MSTALTENALNTKVCLVINRWIYIIDELKEDYSELNITNYDQFISFINTVEKLSAGKKPLIRNKKYASFYHDYQLFFKDLEGDSDYNAFAFFSEFFGDNELYMNYYQYLIDNRENIDKICDNVARIDKLGISRIYFDPSMKFDEERQLYTSYLITETIMWMDNIVVIPTYETDVIRYKGINSNYAIPLTLRYYKSEQDIYNRFSEIRVNNLLFDTSLLPDSLSVATTFKKLFDMKKENKQSYDSLNDSVLLSVGLHDLEETFITLDSYVNHLKTIKDKTILKEALKSIADGITKLSTCTDDIILDAAKEDEQLTPDYVMNQKDQYIRRREISRYDID